MSHEADATRGVRDQGIDGVIWDFREAFQAVSSQDPSLGSWSWWLRVGFGSLAGSGKQLVIGH